MDKLKYDELVLYGRNMSFEELDYPGQDIEFNQLEKVLQDELDIHGIDQNILKSLELYKNGSYNNAAGLLADKNVFKETGIDLICYEDNTMMEIRDRTQVSGVSVLEHYNKCIDFYNKHINKKDIIKGAKRISFEEIPEVAYREAIVNSIIHRDYSRRGNNRIEIFEDRIEVVSIGSLPLGISAKEFLDGNFSNARNRILANIFYRIKLIEKLGTGIRRIKNSYMKYNEKPEFQVMENSIKIILPFISINEGDLNNKMSLNLTLEEDKLLNYIKSSDYLSRSSIEKYMNIGKTKAVRLINGLLAKKVIKKLGTGRNTRYSIR